MTAQEARNKALWYRLDPIIKQRITEDANHGLSSSLFFTNQ